MASEGPAVDRRGNEIIDPTKNVLDLVAAAIKRQDDLREMESTYIEKLARIREQHARELRKAESDRINAIRSVDVGAVAAANAVADTRATTLAAQVTAAADAVRVALAAETDPIKKDIADLRRVQYEQQGQKAQVVEGHARSAFNISATQISIQILLGLVAIASFLFAVLKK